MDLAMMLSGEKRDPPPPQDSPTPKRTRADPSTPAAPPPPQDPATSTTTPQPPSPNPARPSPPPSASHQNHNPRTSNPPEESPYSDLQRAVHNALENKTEAEALTTADKVALALEVLRARQLELDLAQARNNIEALVNRTGSAPRTLRAVIPASTVSGLPVGTPVDITAGKFLLSPTSNDPQALFLTLELKNFGKQGGNDERRQGTGGGGGGGGTVDGEEGVRAGTPREAGQEEAEGV